MTSPETAEGRGRRVDRRALLVGTVAAGGAVAAAVVAAVLTAAAGGPPTGADEGAGVSRFLPAPSAGTLRPDERTGEPVPAAPFETLDGAVVSFADYRGRPLVVNFFASWCVPCIAEMPAFEEVHRRLGDEVAFLGLNFNEDPALGRGLAERTGVTYDLASDADGSLLAAFGAVGMPTTAFVSPDGRILEVVSGELTGAELEKRIAEVFA